MINIRPNLYNCEMASQMKLRISFNNWPKQAESRPMHAATTA